VAEQRRQHPTLSDVALALATRRSDPTSKVQLTLNAKGDVQIEVDVTDTDPKVAADQAADLFDVLRARYPREVRPEPPKRDEDEKEKAANQALRGRIAAAKGRSK
jgi:hypothetical protein